MAVVVDEPVGRGLFGQIRSRWRVFVSEVVSIVLRKLMSAQLRRSLKSAGVLNLLRQRRRLRDQLEIVELHRPGEEAVFSDGQLIPMLELGKAEIRRLVEIQESSL